MIAAPERIIPPDYAETNTNASESFNGTDTMRARQYESWGRYPKSQPHGVKSVFWQDETSNFEAIEGKVLPYGYGRSYGDTCLNDGGTLIDMTGLRRFISFDEETGLLRCEAGVMLADILDLFIPRGWFLPVTPGTKFVSIADHDCPPERSRALSGCH